MTTKLQIDFISDVACPWCAIGLFGLEEALRRTAGIITADITFRPFELNPDMPAAGENHDEHLAQKYGGTALQVAGGREPLRARAASVGFDFKVSDRSRVYNTFDAHRLLHWAQGSGLQVQLKRALFKANFTDDANISDPGVLIAIATAVGLDAAQARAVVGSQQYAKEVRAEQQLWLSRGINSVPGIVINKKWLISGGQPPEAFEEALRSMVNQS